MAIRVKWMQPELEDNYVHILYDSEWTLCGAAFEGWGSNEQDFVKTRRRATCPDCIEKIKFCKNIKSTEYHKL